MPLAVISIPRTLTSGAAPICAILPKTFKTLPSFDDVSLLTGLEDPDELVDVRPHRVVDDAVRTQRQ